LDEEEMETTMGDEFKMKWLWIEGKDDGLKGRDNLVTYSSFLTENVQRRDIVVW